MQVKRYRTPTVREALSLAREELGPQALVLSTRMVSAGGVRGLLGHREVELTAMVPTPVSAARPSAPAKRRGAVPRTEAVTRALAIDPTTVAEPQPALAERLLSRFRPSDRSRDELIARLQAAGLDRRLAREVAEALPLLASREPSWPRLRRTLADLLAPVAAPADETFGLDVFVGPPGAGKTTTIAKLAAQARARRGPRISIVAADGYRVGAVEQLRLYSDIIGAPFTIARSPIELDRVLHESRRPVLVDTAGRSPSDVLSRDLFDVIARQRGVRTHLVMPGATPARDAERFLDLYAPAHPTRVILTKVDETETLSPLVGLLRERQLAVSFLGIGQRVPEDLRRATPAVLASCVLGEGVDGPGPARVARERGPAKAGPYDAVEAVRPDPVRADAHDRLSARTSDPSGAGFSRPARRKVVRS